jgi:hypothetical protein
MAKVAGGGGGSDSPKKKTGSSELTGRRQQPTQVEKMQAFTRDRAKMGKATRPKAFSSSTTKKPANARPPIGFSPRPGTRLEKMPTVKSGTAPAPGMAAAKAAPKTGTPRFTVPKTTTARRAKL